MNKQNFIKSNGEIDYVAYTSYLEQRVQNEEMILDDTIELLTKQMLEDVFKDKKENKEEIIRMSKTDLYKFCIKLVKLIQRVKNVTGSDENRN